MLESSKLEHIEESSDDDVQVHEQLVISAETAAKHLQELNEYIMQDPGATMSLHHSLSELRKHISRNIVKNKKITDYFKR